MEWTRRVAKRVDGRWVRPGLCFRGFFRSFSSYVSDKKRSVSTILLLEFSRVTARAKSQWRCGPKKKKASSPKVFPSFLQPAMTSLPRPPRPKIEISPLTADDFEDLARAQLAAMKDDNVYNRIFPVEKRPSAEVRIRSSLLCALSSLSPSRCFSSTMLTLDSLPILVSTPSPFRLLSFQEHSVHTRTSRPFPFSPATSFEIKASLPGSSKLIGFASWEVALDKTATLGGPTAEEELEAKAKEGEEKSPTQREKDATMDLGFYEAFKGESKKARIEVMQGKVHWYLVGVFCFLHSGERRDSERRRDLSSRP